MYNIYTVYKRVSVHWTLIRRTEICDSEQRDWTSVYFKCPIWTDNQQRSRSTFATTPVDIKTGSVRLVSVIVWTMLPLIARYDHIPALISLLPESLGTLEVRESAWHCNSSWFWSRSLNSVRFMAKIQTTSVSLEMLIWTMIEPRSLSGMIAEGRKTSRWSQMRRH